MALGKDPICEDMGNSQIVGYYTMTT